MVIVFVFAVSSSCMMGFLPTFELVVMSFGPTVVRFSGDNEVSTCSGDVSSGQMRFLRHHTGKMNTVST